MTLRHKFFQSFASIGRVDLVSVIVANSRSFLVETEDEGSNEAWNYNDRGKKFRELWGI